jgi:hypothetical protein
MDNNNSEYIIEKTLHKGVLHCKAATVSAKQGAFNTQNGNSLGKLRVSRLFTNTHLLLPLAL